MKPKQLNEFTTVELKALVYDLNAEIYKKKQAVEIINQEIGNRNNPIPEVGSGSEEPKEEIKTPDEFLPDEANLREEDTK